MVAGSNPARPTISFEAHVELLRAFLADREEIVAEIEIVLNAQRRPVQQLRDRGLLAYHLQDFAGALRDLEAYLRLLPRQSVTSDEDQELADEGDSSASSQPASEHEQIWEHVKTLRKRVAGFN